MMFVFLKRRRTLPKDGQKNMVPKEFNGKSSSTCTIGGAYRSSLSHQSGTRVFLRDDSQTCSERTADLDTSWSSSGASDFHKHTPLFVDPARRKVLTRQGSRGAAKVQPRLDAITELGHILAKDRQLPGTWYYSSNHILVNKERVKRNIPALIRRIELDALARERAEKMAKDGSVVHGNPDECQFRIQPCRRFGENVACGTTIRDIHTAMVKNDADRNNMIDRRYSNMGMGTARGKDGTLYLCQIFKG